MIKISEHTIEGKKKSTKVAIFYNGFPGGIGDAMIQTPIKSYIDNEKYIHFVHGELNNPYVQVITTDISKLPMTPYKSERIQKKDKCSYFTQDLLNKNGKAEGKFIILTGGLDSENPRLVVKNFVQDYMKGRRGDDDYLVFTEISLSCPWTAIIIDNVYALTYEQYDKSKHGLTENVIKRNNSLELKTSNFYTVEYSDLLPLIQTVDPKFNIIKTLGIDSITISKNIVCNVKLQAISKKSRKDISALDKVMYDLMDNNLIKEGNYIINI